MIPINIPWMGLAKILGPIVLLIGVAIYHNRAVDAAFDDGAQSRQIEVDTLTGERDTALADVKTLKGDLGRCRSAKDQAEAKVESLNSRIIAQADENAEAMRRQAEQFAAAQSVTSNAMETLARNTKATDIDFAAILEQLKGVTYDYDNETNRCVIRGGGRILRDAARGKIGN